MNITRVGIDLVKQVFQIHGVDRTDKVVIRKQLRRAQMRVYFIKLHDLNFVHSLVISPYRPNFRRFTDKEASNESRNYQTLIVHQ